MISTRIASTVEQLGLEYREITSIDDVLDKGSGDVKQLLEKIAHWDPGLIIMDLGSDQIPWKSWIESLKSSSTTGKIPILCFGPHVEADTLQAARNAGADQVVARSRFMSAMPALIQKYTLGKTDAE
jgi:CheY-like chemotaxis protein